MAQHVGERASLVPPPRVELRAAPAPYDPLDYDDDFDARTGGHQ